MRLFSCIALGFATYLAWTAYRTGDVIGCSAEGVWDCGHVLHSRWSKVFGVPVSIPAGAVYASLLVALGFAGNRATPEARRKSWSVITILAISAGAAAIWFICLQIFVLRSLCIYCISTHAIGLLLSVAVLYWQPLGPQVTRCLGAIGLVGVIVLITSQSLVSPPPTFAIDYHQSDDEFDITESDELFLGPTFDEPTAEAVVVEDPESAQPSDMEKANSPAGPVKITSEPNLETSHELGWYNPPRSTRGQSIVAAVCPIHVQLGAYLDESGTVLKKSSARDVDRRPDTGMRGLEKNDTNVDDLPANINPEAPENVTILNLTHVPTSDHANIHNTLNPNNRFAPMASMTPTPKKDATHSDGASDTVGAKPVKLKSLNNDNASQSQDTTPVRFDKSRPLSPKRQQRIISVMGGRVKLNSYTWPIVGCPDAPHVLVELFDYTCPHCREMNDQLKVAMKRFGNQLAVLTLPVPLSHECNDTISITNQQHQDACELARLALSVWRKAPDSFPDYHNWLFETSRSRTAVEARHYAAQLVGHQALNMELGKPIVNQYIAKHVLLYKRAGQGTVPKLMTEHITLRGQTGSSKSFCTLLEAELNIQPITKNKTASN